MCVCILMHLQYKQHRGAPVLKANYFLLPLVDLQVWQLLCVHLECRSTGCETIYLDQQLGAALVRVSPLLVGHVFIPGFGRCWLFHNWKNILVPTFLNHFS